MVNTKSSNYIINYKNNSIDNTYTSYVASNNQDKSVIYSDLNVRLKVVGTTDINIANAKAILQSVTRLMATQEGEIPYYRNYGLNLKKYLQKPLTKATANEIYDYVQGKIETYEPRVNVISAITEADFNNGIIYMKYTLQVKTTGEIIQTDYLGIKVLV